LKNFPHQFNDLNKLYEALAVTRELINNHELLTDEIFGEQLTRHKIYTYRNKSLTIDDFLNLEREKPLANRGYLTVARDIRRFFELLGFLNVFHDKSARLSPAANQLLKTNSSQMQIELWRNALFQLALEGTDGEISHPYRILIKLVNTYPGIETTKLMLALEAENDSDEEFERLSILSSLSIEKIIAETGTTSSMAANAVKILPGIAEQIGDIERKSNQSYPVNQVIITEDEITTEKELFGATRSASYIRETNSERIAKDPNINIVSSANIDLVEAIKIRQKRLVEHQNIVRNLAILNENCGFKLFEGKFDCLAIKDNTALLYEVKTILPSLSDQEKQTIKGVGQLKYYKFSIVNKQMGFTNIREILAFSCKPDVDIIEFCLAENIIVVWMIKENFDLLDLNTSKVLNFNPKSLL